MTKWAHSLIRLSTFEVETLQKRLAEVVHRRTHVEMKIATIDAECEIECVKASMDPHLSRHLPAFKRGVKLRRDTLSAELDLIVHEENGVRDSLSNAFEDLKKFEHVAEVTRLNRIKAEQKIENAQMDESALRASAGRKRA